MHFINLFADAISVMILENLLYLGCRLGDVGGSLNCFVDLSLYLVLVAVSHIQMN